MGLAAANVGGNHPRRRNPASAATAIGFAPQLIATPDAFDGKYIAGPRVRPLSTGTAIYLHREDLEHMLTKNGLWLAASDTAPEGSKEAQVNDRYALIEGRFTAKKKGHRSLWSGSIEDITRMEPWEIRKTKK